jgi:hypothetical protein
MDKLERYREIIKNVLRPIAERRYTERDVQNEAVCDTANDRYLVMSIGWQYPKRVHGCIVHLDIIDGKVWIHQDSTEDGIAYDLEAAGIPKSDIVLGFHPADVRPHTGYAVA